MIFDDTINTILISRTLTRQSLCGGDIFSSSEKFEKEFIEAYSSRWNISIYSFNNKRDGISSDDLCEYNFNYSSYIYLFWYIFRIPNPKSHVIISTGYNPVVVGISLALKLRGGGAYAFIYDSHLSALTNKTFFKSMLIKLYFEIGFRLARNLSGWIVLNDKFIHKLRININFLKIKVGSNYQSEVFGGAKAIKSGKIFFFSGTLNEDNGVHVLLRAFELVNHPSAQLHIYGSGPLQESVKAAAEKDPRIKFFGRTSNAVVISRQMAADFLIHLRDPACVSAYVAYPSKLIEYISSGSMVISNIFPGIDDAIECVTQVDNFDARCLSAKMNELLDLKEIPAIDAAKLAEFLSRRQWSGIAADVRNFVAHK